MILASLTGSSFRKNRKDVFSHAFLLPVIPKEKTCNLSCFKNSSKQGHLFNLRVSSTGKRESKKKQGFKVLSTDGHIILDPLSESHILPQTGLNH